MWPRLASNSRSSSPECWVTGMRHRTQLYLVWLWHRILTLRLADLPKIFHSATSSTFVLVTLFNTSLPCSPKNRCVCVHTSAFHSVLSDFLPICSPSFSLSHDTQHGTYLRVPRSGPLQKEPPDSREADSLQPASPVCAMAAAYHLALPCPHVFFPTGPSGCHESCCFSKDTRFASE